MVGCKGVEPFWISLRGRCICRFANNPKLASLEGIEPCFCNLKGYRPSQVDDRDMNGIPRRIRTHITQVWSLISYQLV
jgi:hypothetical protein